MHCQGLRRHAASHRKSGLAAARWPCHAGKAMTAEALTRLQLPAAAHNHLATTGKAHSGRRSLSGSFQSPIDCPYIVWRRTAGPRQWHALLSLNYTKKLISTILDCRFTPCYRTSDNLLSVAAYMAVPDKMLLGSSHYWTAACRWAIKGRALLLSTHGAVWAWCGLPWVHRHSQHPLEEL